ncbi:hypothetical protein [uncultured Deinococcus sp.]|uniref:hypothetical protein n=1 Tax=uncultured Deinococcus sp. TaxID=158789 RepID=UPI0025E86A16|nr:hypothetical protein [uncultured Deinococcus sp.]
MTRNRQQRAARQARIRRFLQQPRPWPARRMPPPVYAPPRADVMVFEVPDFGMPLFAARFGRAVQDFSDTVERLTRP